MAAFKVTHTVTQTVTAASPELAERIAGLALVANPMLWYPTLASPGHVELSE